MSRPLTVEQLRRLTTGHRGPVRLYHGDVLLKVVGVGTKPGTSGIFLLIEETPQKEQSQ